jgi:hypothetical protein
LVITAQRLDHILVVVQRLSHAHENDVGQGHPALEAHPMLDIAHLGNDLAGGQVARPPPLGRHAETAPLAASHLAGDAKGEMVLFGMSTVSM